MNREDEHSSIAERHVSLPHVRREVWLVPLFALLTTLGAMLRIHLPGTPIPATMQTFFVLVAGGIGGVMAGSLSQLLYLGLGLCGLPFFAGLSMGGAFTLSPTFGYLIGFIFAAGFMGMGRSRDRSLWMWILKALAATTVIHIFGLSYFTFYTAGDIGSAFAMGVIPFIPWDIAKAIAAAIAIQKLNRRFI
ncbi:MAG: biotin transporter BioY [Candidatus Glassbacteria bacterium]